MVSTQLPDPLRFFRYLWPAPITLLAAGAALLAGEAGASLALRDGILEASGGPLGPILRRIYPPMAIGAITLGHVVLAQDAKSLGRSRQHEQVHVRQYERWGVVFPLAYLVASGWALLSGGDPYRDNRFEREAFAADQLDQVEWS